MTANGFHGDRQRVCNLLVAVALVQKFQDFQLASGQHCKAWRYRDRWCAERLSCTGRRFTWVKRCEDFVDVRRRYTAPRKFAQQGLQRFTQIDKETDARRSHLSDALGYYLWWKFRPFSKVGEQARRLM